MPKDLSPNGFVPSSRHEGIHEPRAGERFEQQDLRADLAAASP